MVGRNTVLLIYGGLHNCPPAARCLLQRRPSRLGNIAGTWPDTYPGTAHRPTGSCADSTPKPAALRPAPTLTLTATSVPTPTPTPKLATKQVATERLSSVIPWFSSTPDQAHVAVSLLTGIWLQDATLGDTVAGIPWVNDGVDFDELQFIEMLLGVVGKDLELARTMAALPWVTDGVNRIESYILGFVISNIDADPQRTKLVLNLPLVTDFEDELSKSQVTDIIDFYLNSLSDAPTDAPSPLVEQMIASDWYRDGLNGAYEAATVRALKKIDENNPELASVMSRWAWIFDEDWIPREGALVTWLAAVDEKAPEFLPLLTNLPWIPDGVDRWEIGAAIDLAVMATQGDLDSAVELATAPWVVDGVTFLEALFGITYLSDMATRPVDEHSGPEIARQVMGLINYPPQDIDLYLVFSLYVIMDHDPDSFERLLTEPWFIDGLDEEERIYLIAAPVTEKGRNQLFEPYAITSAMIELPHSGAVTLWAVQYGSLHPNEDILSKMEVAVRGSEQFWELPFPVDHVILYLDEDFADRGKHLGRVMLLETFGRGLRQTTLNHEVAHYYFNEGPRWFMEGGAELVKLYIEHDGNIPTPEFPEWCAEKGIYTLQALNDLPGGPVWDACSYTMGLHFLALLRETMGQEAWLSAFRAFYLEFGYEGLYTSTSDSPGDEEVYQAFVEHTPPEIVNEVKDVFRVLHSGSFTIPDAPFRTTMATRWWQLPR